jgi:hypothetical protein
MSKFPHSFSLVGFRHAGVLVEQLQELLLAPLGLTPSSFLPSA